MAEGAGFEPARRFITVYTLSRRAPSTARPPLPARLSPWALGCQTIEAAESAQRDERGQSIPRELLPFGGGKVQVERGQIVFGKRDIERSAVLAHMLWARCFGDHDRPLLPRQGPNHDRTK